VPSNRKAPAQTVDPAAVDERAEALLAEQLGDAFLPQNRNSDLTAQPAG